MVRKWKNWQVGVMSLDRERNLDGEILQRDWKAGKTRLLMLINKVINNERVIGTLCY